MDLVQRLAHPGIVVAYEVGEDMGLPYIVMEKLTGPDLNAQVRKLGPMNWVDSLEVIAQAADALSHSHRRKMIHRDVKPGNLIRHRGNRIKIADFGLAALTEPDLIEELPDFQTREEMVAGTPEFMVPEQAQLLSSVSHLADVYGLGATWYFLLTGDSRVTGDSFGQQISCLLFDRDLKNLTEDTAPKAVCDVLNRMVKFDPQDRYESMDEVADAVRELRPNGMEKAKGHGVQVLIVEDNQDDMTLTIEMMREMNKAVIVHEARTLAQAIAIGREIENLDIVFLDLQLPDSFGIETVQDFTAAMPHLPIIVLTGQEDVSVGQACVNAGAEDFTCKNDLHAHLLERIIFITLSRRDREMTPIDGV